jgi:hypothetical protein
MKSIKLLKKQAIKAAQLSFKSGRIDEQVARKFIKSFKTLPFGESILSLNYFSRALRAELNKTTLTIESVIKIPKSEIKALENAFGRQYKILETKEELSPSLLGGVKVKIGDIIFDNSLKAKVAQIGEVLTNG